MMKNKHEKVEPQKITPNYVTPTGEPVIYLGFKHSKLHSGWPGIYRLLKATMKEQDLLNL